LRAQITAGAARAACARANPANAARSDALPFGSKRIQRAAIVMPKA
jgi:hypothetical protein